MGKLIYKGSRPASDPFYTSGSQVILGSNLNPSYVKRLLEEDKLIEANRKASKERAKNRVQKLVDGPNRQKNEA